MGAKSRAFYSTGNKCLKQCANREDCDNCLNFSNWELPEVCDLFSIASWCDHKRDWSSAGKVKYIIDQKGLWTKVKRDDMMDVLKEANERH